MVDHVDDQSLEPAVLLHEVVMLIEELDPSSSDFLFVQGVLGILSNVLVFEEHEGLTRSSPSLFLDKDVILGEFTKFCEKLGDFLMLNSERQASQEKCPVLVFVVDLAGKRDLLWFWSWSSLTAI